MTNIITHAKVVREKRELPPFSLVNPVYIEYKFRTNYRPGSDIIDSKYDKFVTVAVRQLGTERKVPIEVVIVKPGTTDEVPVPQPGIMEALAPDLGRTTNVGPLTGGVATASSDASAVQFAINTGGIRLGGRSAGGVLGDQDLDPSPSGPELPPDPLPRDERWKYEIKEDDPRGEWTVRIKNKGRYDETHVFSIDISHPDMVLRLSESRIPFSLLNRFIVKVKTLMDIKVRLDRYATIDFRPEFRDLTGLEKMVYEIGKVAEVKLLGNNIYLKDINLKPLKDEEVELKPEGDYAIVLEPRIDFETEGDKELDVNNADDIDITKLAINIGLVFGRSGKVYLENRDLAGKILSASAPAGRLKLQMDADVDSDPNWAYRRAGAKKKIRNALNDEIQSFMASWETKKTLNVIADHFTDAVMFLATGTEDRLFYDLRPTSTDIVVRHYARPTERLRRLLNIIDNAETPVGRTPGMGLSGAATGGTTPPSGLRVLPGLPARFKPRPADHSAPGGARKIDHMLGYLTSKGRTDVHGLGAPANHTNMERGGSNIVHSVFPLRKGDDVEIDPGHGWTANIEQIAGGAMSGFVSNYMRKSEVEKNPSVGKNVMGFYDDKTLDVYDRMADEYLVCNRWFCSHPGPTYPNRFISLSGSTPDIHNLDLVTGGAGAVKGATIFDLLTDANVSWNYVESNIAFLRMFDKYRVDEEKIIQRKEWLSMARNGQLPAVSWVDPHFFELEIKGIADDDHAPSNVLRGQEGVQEIYEALTTNEAQWAKTMLVITYDEHCGYYDHVPPHGLEGETDPVVHKIHEDGATHYGVRVPTFIVSPWVKKRSAKSIVFDHTSILKTILVNFLGDEAATQELLGKRVDAANNLLDILEETKRSDIPLIAKPAPVERKGAKIYVPGGRADFRLTAGLFGFGPKLRKIIADRATEGYPEVPYRGGDKSVIVTIQQKSTMRYLDAHESSGKDYRLVTRAEQKNNSQKWEMTSLGNNTFTLRQVSNGRFVDAYQSEKNDYRVVTRPNQENDTQHWIIKGVDGGLFTIQQKSSRRYMDAHVTSGRDYEVVTRSFQSNDTQRWIVVPIKSKRFPFQGLKRDHTFK